MKKIFALLSIFVLLFSTTFIVEARSTRTKSSDVYVKGYTKKDGTYVPGYYRSAPNSSKLDNYSCIDYGKCDGSSSNSIPPTQSTPQNTLSPENEQYVSNHLKNANQKLQDKNYTSSIALYKTVLNEKPKDPTTLAGLKNAYIGLVNSYLDKKQTDHALQYASEANALFQQDPYFTYVIGIGYLNKEKYDDALDNLINAYYYEKGTDEQVYLNEIMSAIKLIKTKRNSR